jgi:hypothetical protein
MAFPVRGRAYITAQHAPATANELPQLALRHATADNLYA